MTTRVRARYFWVLSSRRMTVGVEVEKGGRIVDGPPIVRRFIGQQFANLRQWMIKQGGYRQADMGLL